MKVYGEPTRSIRSLDNGTAVEIVDQTLLPYRFEKRVLGDWRDCVEAIRTMRVRGAPLIGITGAWAVVLAVKENPENDALLKAAEVIANARPTAVNLSWAVLIILRTAQDDEHASAARPRASLRGRREDGRGDDAGGRDDLPRHRRGGHDAHL